MNKKVIIDEKLLDEVTAKASLNPRLRQNYNFHSSLDEPINRLLNAMNPGTYFPPHRHQNPDKQEIFLVLRGALNTYLFDEKGNITDCIQVNPQKGVYGMEIPAETWHSFIVLEPGTVVYEIKEGPYVPLDSANIAPWAPLLSDTEGIKLFMEKLTQGLNQPQRDR